MARRASRKAERITLCPLDLSPASSSRANGSSTAGHQAADGPGSPPGAPRPAAGRRRSPSSNPAAEHSARDPLSRAAVEWRFTIDAIPDVILVCDPNRVIHRLNRSALALLGGSYADWIGQRSRPSSHAASATDAGGNPPRDEPGGATKTDAENLDASFPRARPGVLSEIAAKAGPDYRDVGDRMLRLTARRTGSTRPEELVSL